MITSCCNFDLTNVLQLLAGMIFHADNRCQPNSFSLNSVLAALESWLSRQDVDVRELDDALEAVLLLMETIRLVAQVDINDCTMTEFGHNDSDHIFNRHIKDEIEKDVQHSCIIDFEARRALLSICSQIIAKYNSEHHSICKVKKLVKSCQWLMEIH